MDDYRAAMKGKGFDEKAVLQVMSERMKWRSGGEFSIIGRGDRPEVECVLFGFVPCWLERGVAGRLRDDTMMDKWLRAHGKFVKGWFWEQWKGFRDG